MSEELEKQAINPALLGALAGSAGGALASGKGNRLKGALGGAALGGAAGYGAGKLLARGVAKAAPQAARHAEQSLPKVMINPKARAATKAVSKAGKQAPKPSPKFQSDPSSVKTMVGDAAPKSGVAKTVGMTSTPGAASSMGELVRGARGAQPTQMGGQRFVESLKHVPADTMRQAGAAVTPEMARMGMTPERAVQIMGLGSRGTPISGVVAKEVAGQAARGVPGRAFVPAAADMATKAASAYLPMRLELIKMGAVSITDVADAGEQLDKNLEGVGIDIDKQRSVGSIRKMFNYIKDREKRAFTESMYSGGLGPGPSRYFNHGPRPSTQPIGQKTAGPPGEGGKKKVAAMADELMKLNAIVSPMSQLGKSQKVGALKVTAPPGPSIQQVAKPVGVGTGTPQPGATKSGAI